MGASWVRITASLVALGRSRGLLKASCRRLESALGASWRRLGVSWGRVGVSLARLGGALGSSWAVLERRRGILEASWSVLRTSWAVFRRFYWHKTVFLSHAILDAIFQSILGDFASEYRSPNFEKS